MNVTRLGALLLTASVAALAQPAAAQTAKLEKTAAAGDPNEVVVTGTLRSQRLQDAPLAVQSVPAEEFVNSGFKEPRELQFLSPSIQVSIQGANAIYIRGSGTNSQNGGTEQSVGMVIDGVLMGFVDDIGGDISDLDHIEVYRGPQGTQFAKNASAGVVSVMTKKPVIGEFQAKGHFTYGEHNDTADNVTFNLPMNEKMALRVSGAFQHRDGVFDNPALGEKQGGREMKGVRAKFAWEASPKTMVYISGDARHQDDKPNFPQAWAKCGPGTTTPIVNYTGTRTLPGCNSALIAGIVPSDENAVIAERDDAYRNTNAGGAAVEVEHQLGDFTLTSLTAYRFMTRFFHGPSGSGYYNNNFLNNGYSGGQASEELRLSSPADKPFTYVAGLFLYERNTTTKSLSAGEAYGQAFRQYPNTPYGADVVTSAAGGLVRSHNVNASQAVYADGTYHFTDKLLLNAGARVTFDRISAQINAFAVPGVYPTTIGAPLRPPGKLTVKETGYTYRIGPQYFFSPDLQVYATYAHGYKGPLIDTALNVLDAIKPETVDMYEVGLKSTWFDRMLTMNLTAFDQKFHNYQVNVLNQTVIPNVFQLGNADGMLSKGVEAEFILRPTSEWTFTASGTYNDSEYANFITSCWNALEPIKQATSGTNGCFVRPGGATASANAIGTPLINNSKNTYRLGVTYNHEFANEWTVDATVNYFSRSSWLSAPMDPNIVNPGYGLMNVNGGISAPGGRYRFGVFARNALDEFFLAGRQANNGGWTNVLNPESVRTIGVSLDFNF